MSLHSGSSYGTPEGITSIQMISRFECCIISVRNPAPSIC